MSLHLKLFLEIIASLVLRAEEEKDNQDCYSRKVQKTEFV